jgi:hypothetical protein
MVGIIERCLIIAEYTKWNTLMICDEFKQRGNSLMLLFGLKTAIIPHIFGQFYYKKTLLVSWV